MKFYNDEYQESEFNMGFGTIQRLNDTLARVNFFFSTKQYEMVFKEIQVAYSEVYPFLKDTERTEEDKTEQDLIVYIKGHYKIQNGKNVLLPTLELDNKLRQWDRRIRVLLLKYKLYMKMQDSRLAAMKV